MIEDLLVKQIIQEVGMEPVIIYFKFQEYAIRIGKNIRQKEA